MTSRPSGPRRTSPPSPSRSARRRRASSRRGATRTQVWFGLGMMGLIGWSVAFPRCSARRSVSGWTSAIRAAFLDAGAAGGRARARLLQRVALGRQGRQGDAGGSRRTTMNEAADHWCWRGWLEACSARSSSAACGGRFARACPSKQPALWFLGSLLLRMSIALAGFYFIAGGHWERLLVCASGICPGAPRRDVADATARKPVKPAREASHAP